MIYNVLSYIYYLGEIDYYPSKYSLSSFFSILDHFLKKISKKIINSCLILKCSYHFIHKNDLLYFLLKSLEKPKNDMNNFKKNKSFVLKSKFFGRNPGFQISLFFSNLILSRIFQNSALYSLLKCANFTEEEKQNINFINVNPKTFDLWFLNLGCDFLPEFASLEHSITILKGEIDFSMDFLGFSKKRIGYPGNNKLYTNEILQLYKEILVKKKIRKNFILEINFYKNPKFSFFFRSRSNKKKNLKKIGINDGIYSKFLKNLNPFYIYLKNSSFERMVFQSNFEKKFFWSKIFLTIRNFSIENSLAVSKILNIFWINSFQKSHIIFHLILDQVLFYSYEVKKSFSQKLINFFFIYQLLLINFTCFCYCSNNILENFFICFHGVKSKTRQYLFDLFVFFFNSVNKNVFWRKIFFGSFDITNEYLVFFILKNTNFFSKFFKNYPMSLTLFYITKNFAFGIKNYIKHIVLYNFNNIFTNPKKSKKWFVGNIGIKKKIYILIFLLRFIFQKKAPISSKIIFLEKYRHLIFKITKEQSLNFELIEAIADKFSDNSDFNNIPILQKIVLNKLVTLSSLSRSFAKRINAIYCHKICRIFCLYNFTNKFFLENEFSLKNDKKSLEKFTKISNNFEQKYCIGSFFNIKKAKKIFYKQKENFFSAIKEEILLGLICIIIDYYLFPILYPLNKNFNFNWIFINKLNEIKIFKKNYYLFKDSYDLNTNKYKIFSQKSKTLFY
jgi:hypothetical protein